LTKHGEYGRQRLGEIQREIALIFDFDDTLAADSTAAFVKSKGIDHTEFYAVTAKRVAQGWDPPLAYLSLLCELVHNQNIAPIKKTDFSRFGKKLKLFPGVEEFLKEVRRKFESNAIVKDAKLSLNYYLISGGIGDIIRSVPIANMFKEIWACEFDYDAKDLLVRPKATISFTEKTKYLFYINKGISGRESRQAPYAVNVDLKPEDRPVPFSHMIYVGDGPSDVPCMSLLKNAKPPGKSILVVSPEKVHKSWELLERGRPVPSEYGRNGHARAVITDAVLSTATAVADKIIAEKAAHLGKKVGY
jgi:hypothetical protein